MFFKNPVAERMVRTTLLVFVVDVIFWWIWSSVSGQVPETNELNLAKGLNFILPFTISRWWDCLFALILMPIVALQLSRKEVAETGLSIILIFGLFIGLALNIHCSNDMFCLSSGSGLLITTAIGFFFGLRDNGEPGLTIGLLAGLVSGLIAGAIYGIAFILVYSLFYALAIALSYLSENYGTILKKFGQWVWAKIPKK
jgi:hypothetical protein